MIHPLQSEREVLINWTKGFYEPTEFVFWISWYNACFYICIVFWFFSFIVYIFVIFVKTNEKIFYFILFEKFDWTHYQFFVWSGYAMRPHLVISNHGQKFWVGIKTVATLYLTSSFSETSCHGRRHLAIKITELPW